MSDPKAGERAALGSRCRELLKSPTFMEAMTAVNDDYERAILSSAPNATEVREQIYREYCAFKRITQRLKSWEQDGVLAQEELERDH